MHRLLYLNIDAVIAYLFVSFRCLVTQLLPFLFLFFPQMNSLMGIGFLLLKLLSSVHLSRG
ncbi:hypothetical protein NC652_014013 [Populus alba x Populus x berolinensis]|nr:hypothetical protein NC652_014013 [Populus alba x Populus x berolinensis]